VSSRFDPLRHSDGVRGGVANLRWEPELELDVGGPRTQVELAIACDCEPPTLTQLAQRLEAAGLISRRPSTTDARAVVVDLTDRGRALIAPLKERWLQLAKTTIAGLDETSRATLHAVMADLARSLSTGGGPRRLPPKSRSSQG